MRRFATLLIFGLIVQFATAQTDSLTFSFGKNSGSNPATYILTGKMTEAGTSDPIEGVGISIDGNYTGVSSDRFGTYLVNQKWTNPQSEG